jgi:ribonuclease P protein subunit POP4
MNLSYSGMLFGRKIEIIASSDRSLLGINGLVVDETKNLLSIAVPSGNIVKVSKSLVRLRTVTRRNETVEIDGSTLIGTPADRIKG